MKNLYVLLLYFLFVTTSCFAFSPEECDSLYEKAELFQSKLFNNIDPFQDEDTIKYSWSPYPLFRTSADLYFKEIKIPPGYYLLTPRTLGGKDYVFFKENGKVAYIIPVAKKENTPVGFYKANVPEKKKTAWQKFSSKVRKKFYDTAKNSGRSTPPSSHIDVKAEIKYIIISLYYGEDKHILLFKRSPY